MPLRRQNRPNYSHLFLRTKPLRKLYAENTLIWESTNPPAITAFTANPDRIDLDPADNTRTAQVTFVRERTGVYGFAQAPPALNNEGSQAGFNELVVLRHYYINAPGRIGNVPSNVHYYQLAISNADPNYLKYNAITINGRRYALTRATSDNTLRGIVSREYWTTEAINSYDWVTDGRLSLSYSFSVSGPTDDIHFAVNVGATSGQITSARILKLPEGTQQGVLLTSASGVGISQSRVAVPRPNQTTTYRLIASNVGGSSHQDEVVNVTQNPVITNFRRTNFLSRPGFATYTFGATIRGTPQPTLRFSASTGETGNIPASDLTSSGVNQWTLSFRHTFNNANARSLTLTATNSSGSVTSSIQNISG